jgi:hypothetical protein
MLRLDAVDHEKAASPYFPAKIGPGTEHNRHYRTLRGGLGKVTVAKFVRIPAHIGGSQRHGILTNSATGPATRN